MSSKLENFGQIFISEVRDNTLETFEKIFDDSMEWLTTQNVRDKISIVDEQVNIPGAWRFFRNYPFVSCRT